MGKKEINYRRVIGFLPTYIDDYGNCTKVILEDREVLYKNSAKSFLNRMSRYYFLDLAEIKKHYGNILGIKHLVPIPFDDKVFIPIKYRKPKFKNDGATGYIDLDWIDSIKKEKSKTKIVLKDERIYYSIASIETIRKHYKNGYIVKRFSNIDLKDQLYDYPATKRDIEILIREVNRIKDRIK